MNILKRLDFYFTLFWFVCLASFGFVIIMYLNESKKENTQNLVVIQPEVIYVNAKFSEEETELITKFIDISLNNDFDWKLMVAVAQLESRLCKSMAGINNCFGITNNRGKFQDFNSKEQSAEQFIQLLKTNRHYREFQQSGKVDDLFRYAEDPNWREKIKFLMNNFE